MVKKWLLSGYRSVSLIGIIVVFFAIIWYAITFAALSGNIVKWGIPLVLSPTQERVLTFQPQVIKLQADLNTQQIALMTTKVTIDALNNQRNALSEILSRTKTAANTEAKAKIAFSSTLVPLVSEKGKNNVTARDQQNELNALLSTIDSELAAGLITKDTATARKLSVQSAIRSLTDSETSAAATREQIQQLRREASTLTGDSSSITALTVNKTLVDVNAQIAQIDIQLATLKASETALAQQISETKRVLNTAQQSPYYEALTARVPTVFIDYASLSRVKEGTIVKDCILIIVGCSDVGKITKIYEAEEYATNPIFRTPQKGRLVAVDFSNDKASSSKIVLFD